MNNYFYQDQDQINKQVDQLKKAWCISISLNIQFETYPVEIEMDQDFFYGASTNVPTENYSSNVPNNDAEDEFNFAQTQYQAPVSQNYQSFAYNLNNEQVTNSYNAFEINSYDNPSASRIRQQEDRIQQALREKSERQYEQKRSRRQEGQRQYEEFQQKKLKQTLARKEENKQKEKEKIAHNAKLSQQAGWKKVAASVPLKQGEHKGQKDVNRMREAIISKRQDEN